MPKEERPSCPALDEIIGLPIKVLDQGYVRLVDYLGTEARIVQAARVSFGEGTKTPAEDAELIRYLLRHNHTSPFEQLQLTLHCKLPIFVARQWVRHRTARLNELSGRYSILKDEFYVPSLERIQIQGQVNRQGSGESLPTEQAQEILDGLLTERAIVYSNYEKSIARGVARELARINLPVATYTEWYWQIDLHNLLHFLWLRCDEHAQWEMRQYANTIRDEIVRRWVPNVWRAFEDFTEQSLTLTCPELKLVRGLIDLAKLIELSGRLSDKVTATKIANELGISVTEVRELVGKLVKLTPE